MRHCIPVCSFICLMHNMVYVISICRKLPFLLFFFQAEDGIRDHCVTGVISYAVFCLDRKSTRLNSSHTVISYAVFCLKKKKKCHSKTVPYVSTSDSVSTLTRIT